MDKFIINGGKTLNGKVSISASKNAILPIMSASILCHGIVKIKSCPMYADVKKMCAILKCLGSKIKYENKILVINNTNLKPAFITNNLTKDIRASIFTLGPMLARFKQAKICYPGGCSIGQRSIGLHIQNFKKLGVNILEQHGYISCNLTKIIPQELCLEVPSVGATENLIMLTCTLPGKFIIRNPAREPEIVDLTNFLNKLGCNITGAGTDCITINGVINIKQKITYTPIPDRIITGTLLIAGAITGGNITLTNCNPTHITPLIHILEKTGCEIIRYKTSLHLKSPITLKNFERVETGPYPAFATDLQSQITTLATICKGISFVKENIFECRFRYVPELIKMGANINLSNNLAVVEGVKTLFGAEVYATDLRGGVSLVLAALKAQGYTTIHNIEHIDRGYYKLEKLLQALGADIKRIK